MGAFGVTWCPSLLRLNNIINDKIFYKSFASELSLVSFLSRTKVALYFTNFNSSLCTFKRAAMKTLAFVVLFAFVAISHVGAEADPAPVAKAEAKAGYGLYGGHGDFGLYGGGGHGGFGYGGHGHSYGHGYGYSHYSPGYSYYISYPSYSYGYKHVHGGHKHGYGHGFGHGHGYGGFGGHGFGGYGYPYGGFGGYGGGGYGGYGGYGYPFGGYGGYGGFY
ncbi:UNVERIFIED_CONTAM: hypothetical protein RMT77_005783 [Armadillidium vulgare]